MRGLWFSTCLALAATGCGSIVAPSDASDIVVDAAPSLDAAPDTVTDAADIPRVNTCSELRVTGVAATPGRAGLAYPGSQLAVQGVGFNAVLRVVVGSVEMPFTRASDMSITTSVPSMLSVGDVTVVVETERCMSAATMSISRLIAVIRATQTQATLLDEIDLSTQGHVDLGSDSVSQASFTLDGASLVTRDATGAVRRTLIADGTSGTISPGSNGPFVLVQGTIQPTHALMVVPGRVPPGLALLDSATGSVSPYTSPSTDPISLAASLEGFRALILDRNGQLYRGDLPFAPAASWAPLTGWVPVANSRSVVMAQGQSSPTNHLGAVFTDGPSPTLIPIDAIQGTVGMPIALPVGVSRLRFLSGDVLVMDSVTPEVIAFDITALMGLQWTVPLNGESAAPGIATHTAVTLFKLAALVLRPGADGIARAGVLHVIDFDIEPPVESGQAAVPDLRGVLGIQGTGNPFVAWTGHTVTRIPGDTPDPAHQQTVDLGAGGDITLVVSQP